MASGPVTPMDDPNLRRQLAELEARLATLEASPVAGSRATPPGGVVPTGLGMSTISTQGGAAVQGAVEVRNGHFIGRDFIQVITSVWTKDDDVEEAKSVIALYVKTLAVGLSGLKLGEVGLSAESDATTPLQLADIYVPLDTTLRISQDMTLEQWPEPGRDQASEEREPARRPRVVTALEAFAQHRELTLLGKPGAEHLGAHVLLMLAHAWMGDGQALGKLGASWNHGALLPIRVVLRRFAEQLPAGESTVRAGDLWEFIGRDFIASGYGQSRTF